MTVSVATPAEFCVPICMASISRAATLITSGRHAALWIASVMLLALLIRTVGNELIGDSLGWKDRLWIAPT